MNAATDINGRARPMNIDINFANAETPVLRQFPDARPTLFSVEFRTFQEAMMQDNNVKLQLQGLGSLYDLAVNLEDEKDKVLERLRKLGLRDESLRIANITATDLRG